VQTCRIFQTMLLCGDNKSTKYFGKLTAVKIECKSWSRILRNNRRIRLEVVLSLQHSLFSLRQLSEWGNRHLIRHLIKIITDSEDLELVGHLLNLQKVQTTFLSTLIKQLQSQVSYRITRLKFRSKRILAKRQKIQRKILQNRKSYLLLELQMRDSTCLRTLLKSRAILLCRPQLNRCRPLYSVIEPSPFKPWMVNRSPYLFPTTKDINRSQVPALMLLHRRWLLKDWANTTTTWFYSSRANWLSKSEKTSSCGKFSKTNELKSSLESWLSNRKA